MFKLKTQFPIDVYIKPICNGLRESITNIFKRKDGRYLLLYKKVYE